MGCTPSRIRQEEVVLRCRDRRHHMQAAVAGRSALAAAYSKYVTSLRHVGAGFSDYGINESDDSTASVHSSAVAAAGTLPLARLPPRPPPLPKFPPLGRSTSLPVIPTPTPVTASANPQTETRTEEGNSGEQSEPAHQLPAAETGPFQHTYGNSDSSPTIPEDSVEQSRIPVSNPTVPEELPPLTGLSEAELLSTPTNLGSHIPTIHKESAEYVGIEEDCEDFPLSDREREVEEELRRREMEERRRERGQVAESTSARRVRSLRQILMELDDQCLKACESGREVSKMLEANRMFFHSNFADNSGYIDHSALVLHVITWNKSFRRSENADEIVDDFVEEPETHATLLDKLLAWEKKLYDEIKRCESMKFEYYRKIEWLEKQKQRGMRGDMREKAKAEIRDLRTRYVVDVQYMHSTIKEINRLRNALYPRLVALVDGLATMWETIYFCYVEQLKIIANLEALDIRYSCKQTSEVLHKCTGTLFRELDDWHSNFMTLIRRQKDYITILNDWVRLSLIPIETKTKGIAPAHIPNPPIYRLLRLWYEELEKLPDEVTRSAMLSFTAVIGAIYSLQQEELRHKQSVEGMRVLYNQKLKSLHELKENRRDSSKSSINKSETNKDDALYQKELKEMELQVDSLEKRLEAEENALRKQRQHVREKSLSSLKISMPVLINAMTLFAKACAEAYSNLSKLNREV